jgi:uncharacterized small protein (DUF1192 family)
VHIWNAASMHEKRGHEKKESMTMVQEDDDRPLRRCRLEPLLLDSLGIEEMRDYIDELKAEIARVEADIARKQGHRSAADAFFRRPSSD